MTRVGFIGLGNMGGPMARNLMENGHTLTVFDLSDKAVAASVDQGAAKAANTAEAVAEADTVITMLPAGQHVREVYTSEGGIFDSAKAGALLIDCSTIDVATARDVSAAAAEKGLAMVDAPVSGGTAAAEAGALTFMVGGTHEAFARAQPALSAMGGKIFHAGDAGAGQAAKICNNMLLAISMIGTCEAFVLAEKLGLAPEKLFEISSAASGQCWSLTSYCPVPGPVPQAPSNRGYTPGFASPMMLKDLKLSQDAAQARGATTPLGAEALSLYSLFIANGGAAKDFSGIIEFLRGKE